jgi:hypothetical protein
MVRVASPEPFACYLNFAQKRGHFKVGKMAAS